MNKKLDSILAAIVDIAAAVAVGCLCIGLVYAISAALSDVFKEQYIQNFIVWGTGSAGAVMVLLIAVDLRR